jgi:hypothetical protein
VVSTNALARVMVVQMVWRGLVAAVVFTLLVAAASGCGNTPLPSLLAPAKSCPGDPCATVACPSGFTCWVDSYCAGHCQAQPVGNRPF